MVKGKKKILKIETKLKKDSQKYKDLDYQQSKLKSALHEDGRQFYKYTQLKRRGIKSEKPTTMVDMENQQTEINEIRAKINKSPISLIKDFKRNIKKLSK